MFCINATVSYFHPHSITRVSSLFWKIYISSRLGDYRAFSANPAHCISCVFTFHVHISSSKYQFKNPKCSAFYWPAIQIAISSSSISSIYRYWRLAKLDHVRSLHYFIRPPSSSPPWLVIEQTRQDSILCKFCILTGRQKEKDSRGSGGQGVGIGHWALGIYAYMAYMGSVDFSTPLNNHSCQLDIMILLLIIFICICKSLN